MCELVCSKRLLNIEAVDTDRFKYVGLGLAGALWSGAISWLYDALRALAPNVRPVTSVGLGTATLNPAHDRLLTSGRNLADAISLALLWGG